MFSISSISLLRISLNRDSNGETFSSLLSLIRVKFVIKPLLFKLLNSILSIIFFILLLLKNDEKK